MDRILLMKTGNTLASLSRSKGDFEDWIISGMQVAPNEVLVMDVRNGSPFPRDYGGVSGIVISGSHAIITDRDAWGERTAVWLRGAIERQIPTLGICYGHQLLAYALGGVVEDNAKGHEFGTVSVYLTEEAREDELLGGFSSPIKVHVSHRQSVSGLPKNAKRLAWSDMDDNQAFTVGGSAWGVQFHPEFDAEVIKEYIDRYREVLLREGQDPDSLIQKCIDTPYGPEILRRFAGVVANSS